MKQIPLPSRKRLVVLARLLGQQTKEKITSGELSELTRWGEATIRRDISLLELHNGMSNGYNVQTLRKEILESLKIGGDEAKKHHCCIIGLGKLGEALLENPALDGTAFEIVAGFDTNVNKIEIMESKIPLFPTLDLERKIRSLGIEFAILAVPDEKAQFIAERLASYGIKGIVNYTNVVLSLPNDIKIENLNTAMILTEMMTE